MTTENSRADALPLEITEQMAAEWADRNELENVLTSFSTQRNAIEDARTLHLITASPVEQPADDERDMIEPLTEPVTISKALRAGRVARIEGTASAATALLANIQIAPWGQSKEWVQGYVAGFNRAAKWMQDALNSTPAYAGAAIRNSALEEAVHAVADHQRDGREWIRDSLWDTLTAEAAARIRALQSTSPAIPAVPHSSTPEWVSVRDRLPANDTWVLAHNGKWTGVAMYVSAAEFVDESWQDERREFIELLGPAVTHWMPMPPAPNDAASARGSR